MRILLRNTHIRTIHIYICICFIFNFKSFKVSTLTKKYKNRTEDEIIYNIYSNGNAIKRQLFKVDFASSQKK